MASSNDTDTTQGSSTNEAECHSKSKQVEPECSKNIPISHGTGVDNGAVGGMSQRPNTVEEFLKMEGANEMFAIQPLTWCPHLTEVTPLPDICLDCSAPCSECGDRSENWICLVCYSVACSRYVKEHMLYHSLEMEHHICLGLSYSNLSVWCYACDHYVDNENTAHKSKFGEALSGAH